MTAFGKPQDGRWDVGGIAVTWRRKVRPHHTTFSSFGHACGAGEFVRWSLGPSHSRRADAQPRRVFEQLIQPLDRDICIAPVLESNFSVIVGVVAVDADHRLIVAYKGRYFRHCSLLS
jgi:hypothetical protein